MKNSISLTCQPGLDVGKSGQSGTFAFTCVELVTVLAVLALMVLLLLPAFARGRVNDHAFQCQNNLRQLLNGWRMYASDSADRLPDAFLWTPGTLSYDGHPDNTNVALIKQSLLWAYVNSLPIFKCPADRSLSGPPTGMVGMPRTRSYSMSQSFRTSPTQHWSSPPWRIYRRTADVDDPSPADLWVFLEEHSDSINDAAFSVAMDSQLQNARWQSMPAAFHEGSCGFSFADGHTESHKWKDRRTFYPVTYNSVFPYGQLQPNNPNKAKASAGASGAKAAKITF